MATLTDALTHEANKEAVVLDTVALVDAEVADKKGVSGMAIKAGYKAVKGIKPGFVTQVVRDLLPEFAKALEPIYEEAKEKEVPVPSYFGTHASRVAEALLAITDRKAENAKRAIVKSTYNRLRGSAKSNVEAAVPRLGALVEKHAP